MRILITGGTGMIGTPLVDRLLKNGHEIRILSRRLINNGNPMVRYYQWDGSNSGEWCEQLIQVDAIINLAGENLGSMRWSGKQKKLIRESRINAGKMLTEAILRSTSAPKVFIQASAIGYYGTNDQGTFTEDSISGHDFLAEISTKWEESSQKIESLGIRRIILRTGVVLSKKEGALNRMLLPFKLFVGGPIGSGKQIISWIHPEDEISAIQFLLENPETRGVYNLTAPDPRSNADFGKLISKIIRRPYWMPIPGFVLRVFLGEMSTLVLNGQYVIPKRLLEAGFEFKFGQLENALKNILV